MAVKPRALMIWTKVSRAHSSEQEMYRGSEEREGVEGGVGGHVHDHADPRLPVPKGVGECLPLESLTSRRELVVSLESSDHACAYDHVSADAGV